jgi:hypothetical protein
MAYNLGSGSSRYSYYTKSTKEDTKPLVMKAIYKNSIFKDIIFNLPTQNSIEPQFYG